MEVQNHRGLSDTCWLLMLARSRLGGTGCCLRLTVVSAGIRDVILPGDMKGLMSRVSEAKKAAEANHISISNQVGVSST